MLYINIDSLRTCCRSLGQVLSKLAILSLLLLPFWSVSDLAIDAASTSYIGLGINRLHYIIMHISAVA